MIQLVAQRLRFGARSGVALAMLSTLLFAIGPGVASAELIALPDETWGVVGLGESQTTNVPAEVMAIEQIDNTIYVGGLFLEVVRRRNEPHHAQPFLAAFDATTGDWIDWWRPDLNGPVFALEASPDGSRLYVGGEFTSVNGIGDTEGLVALDPATGAVDPGFTAQVEGAGDGSPPGVVRTIRAVSSWVYVGGSINFVTGPDPTSRTRVDKVGRVSAANGTPDATWRPVVKDGSVRGLDVDTARGRVYLTGFFESVNDEPDTANFVAVRVSNGLPITTLNRFPVLTPNQPHQFDVLVDGSNVWVAGTQHVLHKLNAADLSIDRRWFTGYAPGFPLGGDYQTIGILGDRIYASCHCWGVIREIPNSVTNLSQAQAEPVAGEVQGLMAFDRTSGDWLPTFLPDIFGQIGGWAIHGGGDGCLWAGGDFNRRVEGDTWRNGIVRWCDEGGQGPPVAPPLEEPPDTSESNRPSRPRNATVIGGPGDDVILRWNASSDDTAVATYIVYRDGVEVGRTRRTELQMAPGGTLSIQAVDTFENVSGFADPVDTSALIPDVVGYWPLDSGALDMTTNGNHGVTSGALNTPGRVIDAQELGAGDSITVAANSDLEIGAGNRNFTISAWLRLESSVTGSLRTNVAADGVASFGTAKNTNRVFATIETSGGPTTALSATHLTVGQWTHVSLVRRGGNLRLYINGSLETTKPLAGSTAAGSGAMTFSGDSARLDEVVVHDGALTAGQVAGVASPSIPDALWAYYPLEGNAQDESGNNFDGVLSGTTTQAAVNGLGLKFDGSNSDEITVADDPALRPGANDSDFTVSYWMNVQQGFTGSWRTITQKGANSSERTFAMWMRPFDNRMHYRISSDEAWNIGGDSETAIVIGKWTHVTYVKRGNLLSLYLNGSLDASAAIPGDVISNTGDIHIGDSPWFSGTAMVLDDYRIYSHGFSQAEVEALAGKAAPPDDPPPPAPPLVDIGKPAAGNVTKTVKVTVDATSAIDELGTLDVDVRLDGGWVQTTWNAASELYEYSWDTVGVTPGPVTVRARAIDSLGVLATAAPVNVVVKADYGSLVLADGAVAYWRLNDGGAAAYDFTDQTHLAYFRGPATQTPPLIGEGGRSATFDGSNDIITVRDHADINTATSYGARSIELWFTSNSAPRRQILWEEGGTSRGISIYTDNGKLQAGAWNRTGPNAWANDVFVSVPFTTGETYYVVLVLKPENGLLKLFVNAERVATASGIGPIESHAGNIGIGARNGSTRFADIALTGGRGNFLDGVIDEVAVYNDLLKLLQIEAHYEAAQD